LLDGILHTKNGIAALFRQLRPPSAGKLMERLAMTILKEKNGYATNPLRHGEPGRWCARPAAVCSGEGNFRV